MLKYQVGDIIELSTDTLALYLADEKGLKLVARGLEFLERWDKKAREQYYLETAKGWRDSDRHPQEEKDKMYEQMMLNYHEAAEVYVTPEELQKSLKEIREAYGEPDNETIGRLGVENRWKFYVDKLLRYEGIWWLKVRDEDNYPSHYGITSWAEEENELGVDYWQWDRTEWYDQQEQRARIVNLHTGQVREVDANKAGLDSLLTILGEEYEAYQTGWLNDRTFQDDVRFEGNMDIVTALKMKVRKLQGR